MGGGSYSYISSSARATNVYSKQSREEIFVNTGLNPRMDIKNNIRECVDSKEHPNAYPIIIGLDVTGSMGKIPYELITTTFPEIMKKIMDEGVTDPQVCFLGIGDSRTDYCPLQVGQFESSDDLLEMWLKLVYLEGHGGGNGGEDYGLAWYFASKHTSIDSFKKHGKKGTLITIGDEPVHRSISRDMINSLFGDVVNTVDVCKTLKDAQKEWNVFHINVPTPSGIRAKTTSCWKEILEDSTINIESTSKEAVADAIVGAIITSYKKNNNIDQSDSSKSDHLL